MATSKTAASWNGKSRARIVLVVPTFPKLSESFIANKFAALFAKGWDVHLVCQDGPEKTEPAVFVPTPEMARQIHVGWPHRPRWRALLLTPVAAVRCLVRRPFGTLRYLWTGNRRFGLDILRRLYLDAEPVCLQPDLPPFQLPPP